MTEDLACVFNQGAAAGQVSHALSVSRRDAYQWRVIYQDGTVTDEYDDIRPDGRGWSEREGRPVAEIHLMANGCSEHQMSIPVGVTPVFFRRRSIELDPNDAMQTHRTVHCIGWRYGQQATYLFVLPNGSTLLTGDFQAV